MAENREVCLTGVDRVRMGQKFIWGAFLNARGVNRKDASCCPVHHRRVTVWRRKHQTPNIRGSLLWGGMGINFNIVCNHCSVYMSWLKTAESSVGLPSMLQVLKRSDSSCQGRNSSENWQLSDFNKESIPHNTMLLFFKAVSHVTQKMSLRNTVCQPGLELAVGVTMCMHYLLIK